MALFASAAAAGTLTIVIANGIIGGDGIQGTRHNIAAAGAVPADNGVISTNGVIAADGGVISSDGVTAADNGVINAD